MCKEFDDKMQEHTDSVNAGRVMELELLKQEIIIEGYASLSDVKGAIDNRLEALNKTKGNDDE